ncbi:MAG: hypothetical protein FDZ75_04130 [Actinobacteria bacterium]|nr:MAG: hypothetical protein FDZ75_04130 [Actinomycetota bacterium]
MSRPDRRAACDGLDRLTKPTSVDEMGALVRARTDVVVVHEPDGTLIEFSDGACAFYGYPRSRMSELPPFGWVASGRMRGAADRLEKVLHDGRVDFESAALLSDGCTRPTTVCARRIDTDRGPLVIAVITPRWDD